MAGRKRKSIGEDTSKRIGARGDLRSEEMPHGEVYRGALADRALGAVGARAMTIDGEIIVNSHFSSNRPEDQALYAHELYHQEHSGGEAGDSLVDAEEISARAIEAMVYHRAKTGAADPIPQKPSELLRDAKTPQTPEENTTESDSSLLRAEPSSGGGYKNLLAKGMSHEEIVQMLALKVMDELQRKNIERSELGQELRSFIK